MATKSPLDIHIPYCRAQTIHPKQHAFLVAWQREALFGGATGPGKTVALAMGALQYVGGPGYSARLLRRTFKQLTQKGFTVAAGQATTYAVTNTTTGALVKNSTASGATIQM